MQLITQYLEADQRTFLELLLEAIDGPEVHAERYARFRAGMLRHIAIEEEILLPAVHRANRGLTLSRSHDLRVEHAALTSLLMPDPDLALCGEIAELLRVHEAVEVGPGGVYEECELLLGFAESRELLALATAYQSGAAALCYFEGISCVVRSANEALAAADHALRE